MSSDFRDRENDAHVGFDIDSATKDELKSQFPGWGELSEWYREVSHRQAWGEEASERSKIQARLENLRDEKDRIRSEIRERQAKLEDVEQQVTRLEERVSSLESVEDKYDAVLRMLESTLQEGTRVFVGHGQVAQAARISDKTQTEVIAELRERNPSIPDFQFVEGTIGSVENGDGSRTGLSCLDDDDERNA